MAMGETLSLVRDVLFAYMTNPTTQITVYDGGKNYAIAQATVVGGVVTGIDGKFDRDFPITPETIITVVGGGGKNATAIVNKTVGDNEVESVKHIGIDDMGEGYTDTTTTNKNRYKNRAFYIKNWYINDPIRVQYSDFPFAVVKPTGAHRIDQYVQEDTEIDNVTVSFFPEPIQRVENYADPSGESVAMIDRASLIIRANPTFLNQGQPRIVNAQFTGSVFNQPGFIGNETAHSAAIHIEVKRREQWGLRMDLLQ